MVPPSGPWVALLLSSVVRHPERMSSVENTVTAKSIDQIRHAPHCSRGYVFSYSPLSLLSSPLSFLSSLTTCIPTSFPSSFSLFLSLSFSLSPFLVLSCFYLTSLTVSFSCPCSYLLTLSYSLLFFLFFSLVNVLFPKIKRLPDI